MKRKTSRDPFISPDNPLVELLPVLDLAVVDVVDDGEGGGAGQSQGHLGGGGHGLTPL